MSTGTANSALALALAALGNGNGGSGEPGNGISRIELLKEEGLKKTYRIYYTNGSTWDYVVMDGFSPSIKEKINEDNSYVLTITNQDGEFDTPNLKADISNLNIDGGVII